MTMKHDGSAWWTDLAALLSRPGPRIVQAEARWRVAA